MTNQIDFTAAAAQIGRLADAIDAEDLARPTPCGEWTVRDLTGHLLGLTHAFTCAARKDDAPTSDADPANAVDHDGQWKAQTRLRTALA